MKAATLIVAALCSLVASHADDGTSTGLATERTVTTTTTTDCETRSLLVTINNASKLGFNLTNSDVDSTTSWGASPVKYIAPESTATIRAVSDECMSGAAAHIAYSAGKEQFKLTLTNPYLGTNSYDLRRDCGEDLEYTLTHGANNHAEMTLTIIEL